MGRVVQVTARAICGRAASNCWQIVVFPPPDGAEISTSSGFVVGSGLVWLSSLDSRLSALMVAALFLLSAFPARNRSVGFGEGPARDPRLSTLDPSRSTLHDFCFLLWP